MKYFAPTRLTENIHETPEGFLLCIGVSIGRVGEMVYGKDETPLEVGEDGRVLVTRDEAELFKPETIASFEGKSLTIQHPEEFVCPDNWKDLAVGILQNVRRGKDEAKDDLVADILVTDAEAIKLVKGGLREVSCGYEAEYTQTGKGKGKQTSIVGNHLALVEEGRAGSSYAITDHKGKGAKAMSKKIGEKLRALFAQTADEVAKVVDEAGSEGEKKDDSKDAKGAGYDELVKMVKDLGEKVTALAGKKDESKDLFDINNGEKSKDDEGKKDEGKKDEDKAKDADKDEGKEGEKKDDKAKDAGSIEDRLAALEAALSKLMEGESEEESEDEESEEESEEEAEDDDVEESVLTGDTASRAEILSPGIKITKDVKAKALKAAYGTEEGKSAIDKLTGGKAPTFDSAPVTDALFIAASELLKASRVGGFAKSKQTQDFKSSLGTEGHMTPEKMNELNAARYSQK